MAAVVRLGALLRRAVPSWRDRALALYALFFVATAAEQVCYYYTGMITSDVYGTLVSRDAAAFARVCLLAVLKLLAVALAVAGRMYLDSRLQLVVRDRITRLLHRQYMVHQRYYLLNAVAKTVDNPDQRMTDDTAKLCYELGKVWTKLVIWPVLVAYYTYRSAATSGYLGPVAALAFFVVGTAINRVLASSLVQLYVRQERLEGHLRYLHVHVRTHAEAIAFLGGAAEERHKLDGSLARALANLNLIVQAKLPVDFATQFFSYVGAVLSYAVIAVPIFTGGYDALTDPQLAARISEAAFVNMYLMSLLTEVILLANDIAALAGYTHRIDELLRWLDAAPDVPAPVPGTPSGGREAGGAAPLPLLAMDAVTVATPSGAVLVRDLTLAVPAGGSLAITGPSGAGKSSLLRVLRGLWTPSAGTITWATGPLAADCSRTAAPAVLFLPQEPFLTSGSLADQVVYPRSARAVRLEASSSCAARRADRLALRLWELLDHVGLAHLLARERGQPGGAAVAATAPLGRADSGDDGEELALLPIGAPAPPPDGEAWTPATERAPEAMLARWSAELSQGERQRLAFARLFYWRPAVAVLDEATSALDVEAAQRLYDHCRTLGIAVVSVTHEANVVAWHRQHLHLSGAGDGAWTLHAVETAVATAVSPKEMDQEAAGT